MDNSPVMKKRRKEEEEKADDLTLQECQEANFDLIMTLANQGLWHICEQIFGHLNYETVENCRKVSELWNESLERIALITFLQEFGDRDVEHCPWPLWEEDLDPEIKVSFIVDGWKKAAKEYGFQASLEDLQEVKDSLQNLLNRENAKCCEYPVHEAAKIGAVKLMEFILRTSFDMNGKDDFRRTAWHEACGNGKTEAAQLIIQNSKDSGIDLNAKDHSGGTAWHEACSSGQTETAKLIIQSSKDFGIDLNAKDNDGNTALHWACRFGLTEIAQLLIQSSKDFGIDLNAKDDNGLTALHEACIDGQTETVQLLIQFSKEFGIDLNAKDNDGWTALHWACNSGRTETIQMILKIWREFNIDIKAQNNEGKTALDFIDYLQGEMRNQIKEMLEKEYSRIDVTESVQSFE